MDDQTIISEWFVPGDGIERVIISSSIQRFLGNDATVRPATKLDDKTGEPINGYALRAYRNFTSAMIEDLKADSAKWKREQAANQTREIQPAPAAHQPNTTRVRQGNDSPRHADQGPVQPRDPRSTSSRIGAGFSDPRMDTRTDHRMDPRMDHRMDHRMDTRMDVDGPPRPVYPVDGRVIYAADGRPYAPEPPHQIAPGYDSRAPVAAAAAYGVSHRDYAPNYSPHEVPPHGYQRQHAGYYGPSPGYDVGPPMPSRNEPVYAFGSSNGPAHPSRAPPGYGHPDYQDPRHAHAYPSPAVTVASSGSRVEPGVPHQQPRYNSAGGPPQPYHATDNDSGYNQPPLSHFEQYGRAAPSQPSPTMTEPSGPRGSGGLRHHASITDTREATRRRA